MKKLFLAASFVIFTLAVNAQDDFRPTAGKKGFTFGLQNVFQNGPGNSTITSTAPSKIGSLLFKYYIADDMAVRAGINYSHSGTKTTDTLSAGNPEVVTKNTFSTAGLQLGIQKSFGEGRLEPYVGADLYFSKSTGKYDQTITPKAGSVTEVKSKNASSTDGINFNGPSSNIGLVPFVGFNYYIAKGFAIGAEFGWGVVHNGSKKDAEIVTTSGGISTTTHQNNQAVSNTWGTKGSGQLQVTVLF